MAQFKNRTPQLSNFSEYHLSAVVAVGDTVISLASVAGLPALVTPLDYIPMVLRDATTYREVVHITAIDSVAKTITVLRGQEGSTARSWPTSAFTYTTLTSEAMRDMLANTWRRPTLSSGAIAVPIRTGNTTFTVLEDQTGMFVQDCALRLFQGGAVLPGAAYVVSSVYDGTTLTTVTISDMTLAASPALDVVEVSQRPSEVPKHLFVADEASLRAVLGLTPGVDIQPYDQKLAALAALVGAPNKIFYLTGTGTGELATLTPFARAVLDDPDAQAVRATIGAQPADATLAGFASLLTAADQVPYSTGLDSFAMTALTAFARTLLAGASAADMRTVLGLGSGALITSGSAALLNAGVAPGNLVTLDSLGRLPALSGENLTNLPVQTPTIAMLRSVLGLVKSLTNPGYFKIDGLIIQFGTTGQTCVFPTAFPSACLAVLASNRGVSMSSGYAGMVVHIKTATGFSVYSADAGCWCNSFSSWEYIAVGV